MSEETQQTQGATVAQKLAQAIEGYASSHRVKSKYVFLLNDVNEVIGLHKKYYAAVAPDERLLLAVNKSIPGCINGFGWSGLLVTDKKVYWRCLSDSFFASIVPGTKKGEMPLETLRSLTIGESDHCFGTNYIGHQLFINGDKKGLLRMGGSMQWDDDALEDLTNIFKAL